LPLVDHSAVAASSVQQEAAAMAATSKTFASRYPPNEEMRPEAKAAWDAMVLGFYKHKVEERNAGRKRSMSQAEWWNMHGHTVSEVKQRKIQKKPSATTNGRAGEEGVRKKEGSEETAKVEVEEEQEEEEEEEFELPPRSHIRGTDWEDACEYPQEEGEEEEEKADEEAEEAEEEKAEEEAEEAEEEKATAKEEVAPEQGAKE